MFAEMRERLAYLRHWRCTAARKVLATEEGFARLWHGKPLGVTVAMLGVLLRAGLPEGR